MKLSLTPKQLEVLRYFRDYFAKHGLAPTLEEAAGDLGVSKITVREHLTHLQGKGAIARNKARARSVQILYDPDDPTAGEPFVSILGTIAAGAPIEVIEDPEPIHVTELIPADDDVYLLRVRGKSMIEDHIEDGDLVVVRSSNTARNGEVVVAIVDGEDATLKRFYREDGNRIRLQPSNSDMDPIFPEHVEIRGVVEGVIRRFR